MKYEIKNTGAIDAHVSIIVWLLYEKSLVFVNIEEDLRVEFSLRDECIKLQPSSMTVYRSDKQLTEDQVAEIKDCLACYISFTINS